MIWFSSLHNVQAPAPAPAPVPRFCRDSLATVLTSSLFTQAFKITSTLASDVCQQMTASEVCSYQPVVTPFLASAALICIHSLWPLPLLWMETPSDTQVQTRSQHLDACRNFLKLILILATQPVMNLQEPNSGRAWSRKWEWSVAVGECIRPSCTQFQRFISALRVRSWRFLLLGVFFTSFWGLGSLVNQASLKFSIQLRIT